jgi:hypothetical protein
MPRGVAKYKRRVAKKEKKYEVVIELPPNVTYEERESILRRAVYQEQDKHAKKPFRFIVVEKSMEIIILNCFTK